MKVIIAGSRELELSPTFINSHMCDALQRWGYGNWLTEVVSGGARGVDASGEAYAHALGYQVKKFDAQWQAQGKAAGNLRNKVMAKYSDAALLFFWGAPSPGTSNMLAWMAVLNKPFHVVVV